MDRSLLAKLHDILKLTGNSKIHYCPELCDEINNIDPELKKAIKHHCVSSFWRSSHQKGCSPFPMDNEMLCIHLADVKASTISRKLRTYKYRSYKTFRIWKDVKKTDEILEKEKNDIIQYFDLLKDSRKYTDISEFYRKYENDFLIRSEDARCCPFASLKTHNELTAIWFTFLLDNSDYFAIPPVIYDVQKQRKVMRRLSATKIAIIRLNLRVNTKLSRLRDAKLIKDIPNILSELSKTLNSTEVYSLPEEVLLISIPEKVRDIAQIVKDTLRNRTNYYFETTTIETELSNKIFLRNYNKIFGSYQENQYPKLEKEILTYENNEASHRAIICDMCQMAPATVVYPQGIYPNKELEIEPVEEFLCEGCKEVRKEADRASNLAKWEKEEDASVAFFRITLDMPGLVSFLKIMFTNTFGFKEVLDEDLGFSIIKEFLNDYEKFLNLFRVAIFKFENYGEISNHELILNNLFCIKIKNDREIKPLIAEYVTILNHTDFFPQMVSFAENNKLTLPIKLSVTTSSVKYPFMEHWQILNNPKEAINVYAIPHTKLEISLGKYICLRDSGIEDKRVGSALHKLAEIEERTKNQFLVKVTMFDMKNDLGGLARYLITTRELSIKETLAYYKIMRD